MSSSSPFVTRNSSLLLYQGKPFRFLSFNTPNLHVLEDPYWQRIDPFEQNDVLSSVSQMGGRVVRIYTISIPKDSSDQSRHIKISSGFGTKNCVFTMNEDLLQDLDRALFLASQHNLKVIIPFIDHWSWWGGVEEFARMYGMQRDDFYTDDTIKTAFKSLMQSILTRNNSLNGLQYRQDPTILAWETGNELSMNNGVRVPSDWTIDNAKYIKQLDTNHLVMDGSYGKYGWDNQVLNSPLIDIHTNHYYLDPNPILWVSQTQLTVILCLIVISIASGVGFWWFRSHSKGDGNSKTAFVQLRQRLLLALSIIAFIISASLVIYYAINQNIAARFLQDIQLMQNSNKPFIVGEIGLMPTSLLQTSVDAFVDSTCPGFLLWSLRGHSRQGGYSTYY